VADGHTTYVAITEQFDNVDVIVFTRDWHPENHSSFVEPGLNPEYRDGSWPKHCVQGTPGAEIDDTTWEAALNTGKPVLLVHKGFVHEIEAYSGFDGIVVDVFNREALTFDYNMLLWNDVLNRAVSLNEALSLFMVRRVFIAGLALDYCVKATALDAQNKYAYWTTVVLDGTRAVNYVTGGQAIADMSTAGIDFDPRDYRRNPR
jgi:nicotinamidase/pyrazinamidase